MHATIFPNGMTAHRNGLKGRKRSTPTGVRRPGHARGFGDLVRSNIIFSQLHPRTIASILPRLTEQSFRTGELIVDEATRGRFVYLILRGRVKITKQTRSGTQPRLAILHEGDFFGELSVIDGLPRSARVEAVAPSRIAVLPATDFRRLMYENAQFAQNVLLNLAIRLRTLDQTFVGELDQHTQASERKMEQLRLLIEASRTVNSTIELDPLLELILAAAARSIRADRGTLYILDEQKSELWAKSAQGEGHIEIRLPLGKGLAGYVAKTGETINIRDAYRDPRFNPEIDRKSGYKTETVLCMPLRDKQGTILGAFQFLNKRDGPFTAEDEAFISAFSIHAAMALYNARLVEERVHEERLAAVGRMAAQIIHDIRSPMATLRLYAETIKRRATEEETSRMSDEMMKQVDRFVNMAQEILDFSRGVSEMKREEITVPELIEAGLDILKGETRRRNIRVRTDLQYTGVCMVDIEKMIRVIRNIAGNAMDAMPDGGVLTITAATHQGDLVIALTDTGSGIPEELRAKIFQPFFTFGKKLGTGLGLAIVKKIVDDHHGRIEVDSTVGKGTTMRLAIPLSHS